MSSENLETFISESLKDESMTCILCKDVLCAPVLLTKEGNVCSECRKYSELQGLENEAFNHIINRLTYPCKEAKFGCKEKLQPSKLRYHQDNCYYRFQTCKENGCKWSGNFITISEHIKEEHQENVYFTETNSVEFRVNLEKSQEIQIILKSEIIFKTERKDEKVYFIFCGPDGIEGKEYSLNFMCGDGKSFKVKSRIYPYKFILKEVDSFDAIDNQILCLLSNQVKVLTCIFKLKYYFKENLLESLKCPLCFGCMQNTIYQCSVGHSFCDLCWDHLSECPICKVSLRKNLRRNYTLENIVKHLPYFWFSNDEEQP